MKNLEIEFKWEANRARAFAAARKSVGQLGASVGSVTNLYITDWYVDTPNRDFEKKQIAMRIRRSGKKFDATFKTRTEIVNGKAVRAEHTQALLDVTTFSQALQKLCAQKRWKGLPVSSLQPIFIIQNKRQIQQLQCKQMIAELSFDSCQILVCGRRVFFKEIELEFKKGPAKILEKLAADLTRSTGLIPARVSKVKTAVSLLKLWGDK